MFMSIMVLNKALLSKAGKALFLAGIDTDEYDVVGESFYSENFAKLKNLYGADDDEDQGVTVILMHDPSNPHSPTRSAIGIYCESYKIGHIPESAAPIFKNLLNSFGGFAKANARIWFGRGDFNSLRLKIGWPVRYENQEVQKTDLIPIVGDGKFSFQMRTSKYPIDWEILKASKYPVLEMQIGEEVLGEDGVIICGEFGRSPYFFCKYGYIAKPRVADENIVNRYLNGIGGQASVKYKLVRTSEKTHKLSLDWNLNKPSEPSGRNNFNSERSPELGDFSNSQNSLQWPGEPDYSKREISMNFEVSNNQTLQTFSAIAIRILKAFGKVLMWTILGMFFILAKVLKSSNKGRRRR